MYSAYYLNSGAVDGEPSSHRDLPRDATLQGKSNHQRTLLQVKLIHVRSDKGKCRTT